MLSPVIIGHVKKREWIGYPGMGAHYIDMAELGDAHPHRPAAIVMNRYVSHKWHTLFSEAASSRMQYLSVAIEGDHRRAFLEEALDHRQADTLRCPRHNDAFPAELRHVRLQEF